MNESITTNCAQAKNPQSVSALKLAEIVTLLLTNTEAAGELDSGSAFACFMTDIADVVAGYCGGTISEQAALADGVWRVDVEANDSLPADGGIWARLADPAPAKKTLSLLRTDNDNCRVYYNGDCGSLYCFLKESHTSFALYLCTVSGEPSSPLEVSSYQIDAVPCGDSSTAADFRAWHNKRTDI